MGESKHKRGSRWLLCERACKWATGRELRENSRNQEQPLAKNPAGKKAGTTVLHLKGTELGQQPRELGSGP